MMVNGLKKPSKVKELIRIRTQELMKETSKKGKEVVKELLLGMIIVNMQVNGKKTKLMVKVFIHILMVENQKENLKITSSIMENIPLRLMIRHINIKSATAHFHLLQKLLIKIMVIIKEVMKVTNLQEVGRLHMLTPMSITEVFWRGKNKGVVLIHGQVVQNMLDNGTKI